jgi:hypothetical protein
MNTMGECNNPSMIRLNQCRFNAALAMLLLLPVATLAGGVVTNCTEAALRAAMAGGGTVTFACDGTITLASTINNVSDTTLDGNGHQVIISGGGTSRVFFISTNAHFTLLSLTVANGSSDNGAGIYNNGYLDAEDCVFVGNAAIAPHAYPQQPGSNACGGALFNAGAATISKCTFSTNVAAGGAGGDGGFSLSGITGTNGGSGFGGAAYNSGTMSIVDCSFLRNSVCGGSGGRGYMSSSYPVCTPGGPGGPGAGGAICNLGRLTASNSTFWTNSALGGTGGTGGGGATRSDIPPGTGGLGGVGGDASGSAVFNGGYASLVNCTFALNCAVGGTGGDGGQGSVPIVPHPPYRGGNGGSGGTGGSSLSVLCDTNGQTHLTNCTLAFNGAMAASGGAGGAPGDSSAQHGTGGRAGGDFGGLKTSGAELVNVLLSGNVWSNCLGNVIDAGHNLSSDGSCAFTNLGSRNNTSPRLGPLANNGGPTLTMALLAGSPAIDAGDPSAAPPTDQRGALRPIGPAPDIGAYEYGWPAVLRVSPAGVTGLDISVVGNAGRTCRLLVSSNFSNWIPIATNQIGNDGTILFHDDYAPGNARRFYRLVMP